MEATQLVCGCTIAPIEDVLHVFPCSLIHETLIADVARTVAEARGLGFEQERVDA